MRSGKQVTRGEVLGPPLRRSLALPLRFDAPLTLGGWISVLVLRFGFVGSVGGSEKTQSS